MADPKAQNLKKQRPPMMLCHYLTPATIQVDNGSPMKETVINQMIDRLSQIFELNEIERIRKAVWDREKEGRTVLENGLAIPHARVPGLSELKACLTLLPQGYTDPNDKILVRMVFLFLSPQEQFESHLQMLAKISRLFQDTRFVSELLAVHSPEEAFQLIQRQERL
jgi:mannitol/fructose-specific phosphotransferase system IIA component (Ntr-type)